MTKNELPKLSIIIAAWNNVSYLRECLSSLENQIENTEVIVTCNFENGISESETRFPFARHIFLSENATVPQLRARGIFESKGAIVALTEDFCTFDSAWRLETEKAHESSFGIIGGAIENGDGQTALDWAVYFSDYGKYMPPNRAGISDALSGMNVSYKREILEPIRETFAPGFYETFVNEELKRRGCELYLLPSAIVFHHKNYRLKKTVSQFFHQARTFAARRVSGFSLSKRIGFILISLILPVLLPARIILRTIGKHKHFRELIISLPFLAILTSAWSFGEFCGYLSGEGRSGRKWK